MTRKGGPALFSRGDRVAVLGLGVSGTAAARLLHSLGADVYASDAFEGPGQREVVEALAAEGIAAEVGRHDIPRILDARLVVTSPGISPSAEIRRTVSEAGLPTVAEIEVAYRHLTSRVIGITGTNGKTTTTALCGHVLAQAGVDALTAGNIGRPLSEVCLMERQPDWVVVELSSFQLADLRAFRPEIGVLANLAPDHLDWYPSLERYYRDKARLFANADADSRWILNGDDAGVLEMARGVAGRHHLASIRAAAEAGAWLDETGQLVHRLEADAAPETWIGARDLRLVGAHNVMNALLAGLAAALAGCDAVSIGAGLASFRGLPHRLQRVGEFDGVLWVNDSKGTNLSATKVALNAFRRPLVALLGGRHKGESYGGLGPALRDHARGVIAFGEAAPRIVRDLEDAAPIEVAAGMAELVQLARRMAAPGDVVLFSPACSSYDMFPDYRARGRAFERCVRESYGRDAAEGGAEGAEGAA